MKNYLKFLILLFLVGLLVLIRVFENDLFYDPYLLFFQNDYLYIDSPRREVFKLTMFTSLRYLMNTLISLAILFVVFKDKNIIKFSAIIYTISFVGLILLFLYFVTDPKREQYYLFFNIRRFLIQPIILLLLLPAFYYNKLKQ
ncbi:MAG TPA: exosortase F system-associated protein [Flavobacteriaceae bacterium]|nr:exosortase F system-associated protein [Flavobacteriaceae bacterium]